MHGSRQFGQEAFDELNSVEGLAHLDKSFLTELGKNHPELMASLQQYRVARTDTDTLKTSTLLLQLAPILEEYIGTVFGIHEEISALKKTTLSHDSVMHFKKEFVEKRVRRFRSKPDQSFNELNQKLSGKLPKTNKHIDDELRLAEYARDLLNDKQANADDIDLVTRWCYQARNNDEGRTFVSGWSSFRLPKPIDYAHLVPVESLTNDPAGRVQGMQHHLRHRDGFALTDKRMSERDVQAEVHYCVYCHDHDGDFCSKGFPEKKKQPDLGLKVNTLGEYMTGCPLEEKISEMHALQREGNTIAALAMAMADNPMLPATGHRICNDCMKACIYQKQDPVNIPQIETRILTDVLDLPWGVEIYHLLVRWNPLRHEQYRPKAYNGHNVLISGMGPAGFTMAHHLTMEGCGVMGIDGLKIEPLPPEIIQKPVQHWRSLVESLDSRILAGFGGVAEYGITVRWDKNFLKLIYLTLSRRFNFQVFGGVRLGGTLKLKDAWRMNFEHVCIANGAGLPRVVPMGNSLARGMRQANDFLMALQLTGAAKKESLASLQIRMPIVVIGGGLTAIDTATEAQTYYIAQVEKTYARHETLVAQNDEETIYAGLDEESRNILKEFLLHGREVREERERAAKAKEQPDFIRLLRSWGGATIVYRRGMNESPAYLRNHEEIIKAMEEGIYYAQGLQPIRAELDEHGHVKSLVSRRMKLEEGRWLASREEVSLPARAVLVAAGATPNTIYEREHPGTFLLEDNHFVPHICHSDALQPAREAIHCKDSEFGPFTSYEKYKHTVSFLGDTHPVFHGSVVKAIASAKRSYPHVMKAMAQRPCLTCEIKDYEQLKAELSDRLQPRIASINTDHPAVIEIMVHAPQAARNFKPGQFFRLQTYETRSTVIQGTRLQIPLQTVSGAGTDGNHVRLLMMRFGVNARLVERLKPGTPIVLMGPTGAPTHVDRNKTVLIISSNWGAATMLALGPALKAAGNKVLYIATLGSSKELYCRDELEACTDQIIWATGNSDLINPGRATDISIQSNNIVDLLERYAAQDLGTNPKHTYHPLDEVDEIIIMGATGLLRALQHALKTTLKPLFKPEVQATGTVGSPMQCMLQGVCAQCLQWQIDPVTGERTRAVFSCSQQDQPLFWIDIDNLAARQSQNRLPDYLSYQWLMHILDH